MSTFLHTLAGLPDADVLRWASAHPAQLVRELAERLEDALARAEDLADEAREAVAEAEEVAFAAAQARRRIAELEDELRALQSPTA
jgi:chromosome segregation ATPase